MTSTRSRTQGWHLPPSETSPDRAQLSEGWALVGHGTWLYLPATVTDAALRMESELAARDHLPVRDPTFDSALRASGDADLRGWELYHEQTRAHAPLHPLTVKEIDALFDPMTGHLAKQPTRVRNGAWSGKYRTVAKKEGPSAPGRASRATSHQ